MDFGRPGNAPAHPGQLRHEFFTGLTKREYAAIHLRVPASGTDWLDAMIRERMRDDLAQAAMQALIATPLEDWPDVPEAGHIRSVSKEAYAQADRVLAARGGAR